MSVRLDGVEGPEGYIAWILFQDSKLWNHQNQVLFLRSSKNCLLSSDFGWHRTIHLLVNIFNLDFRNSPSLPGHVGYNEYHHSHSEMKQRDNSLDFMDNLSDSDPIQFEFSWPLQDLDWEPQLTRTANFLSLSCLLQICFVGILDTNRDWHGSKFINPEMSSYDSFLNFSRLFIIYPKHATWEGGVLKKLLIYLTECEAIKARGDLELWWNLKLPVLGLRREVVFSLSLCGLVPVFLHHLGHDRLVGLRVRLLAASCTTAPTIFFTLILSILFSWLCCLPLCLTMVFFPIPKTPLPHSPQWTRAWHLKTFFAQLVLVYIIKPWWRLLSWSFFLKNLVDSKLNGKLVNSKLVDSELLDQQQLNLHRLSFYSWVVVFS